MASSSSASIDAAGACRRPRALFLNRSYWPDAEATGQLLTELLEDLSAAFDVAIIAGRPNANPERAPCRVLGWERHGPVRVCRAPHFRFAKRRLLGRAINHVSYLLAALVAGLAVPRPAVVVVETDPPLLGLLGGFLRHWHGCPLVVHLQDIYPDVAVALGKLPDGRLTRWLRELLFGVYRRADRIIVLSRDMEDLLVESGVARSRIARVPNWADTLRLRPLERANPFRARHGIDGQFVVMYSGNMGLSQPLEALLEAARRLRDETGILFVLIGGGVRRPFLEQLGSRLRNVRFFDYEPTCRLAESLGAADLHVVPLAPGLVRCLMPSKLYGVMASGTAVLAAAPGGSELAGLVRGAGLGLVVEPGDAGALAEAIRWCAAHRGAVRAMGQRGRAVALRDYDRAQITGRIATLLRSTLGPRTRRASGGGKADPSTGHTGRREAR